MGGNFFGIRACIWGKIGGFMRKQLCFTALLREEVTANTTQNIVLDIQILYKINPTISIYIYIM